MNAIQKLFNWFKKRKIVPRRLENLIIDHREYDQFKITLLDQDGELIMVYERHIPVGDRLNIDFIEEGDDE